ncbi:MAG: two-component sensor histidine kinase, partial [Bacteroidales bacterium]
MKWKGKLHIPFHKKLFVSLATLFLIFLTSVFVFQYKREKDFRERELNAFLSNFNVNLYHSLKGDSLTRNRIDSIVNLFDYPDLRISMIDGQGVVVYDTEFSDTKALEKHADRPEVIDAKKKGAGYSIRYSTSLEQEYFYSAQYFDTLIVRSALPYNV